MTNNEIVTQVNELMHRGFEIPMEKLTPDATLFDQLGLDSLDAVDMLVHLEENLGVKVDAEKLITVRTMQDIYSMIENLSLQQGQKSQTTQVQLQPQLQAQLSH